MRLLPFIAFALASCTPFDTRGSADIVRINIPYFVQEVVNADPSTRLVFLRQSKSVNYLVELRDTQPSSLAVAFNIAPGQTVETQAITNGVLDIYMENWQRAGWHPRAMLPLLAAIADSLNPDKL